MPGITAFIKIRSGVTCSGGVSALSPSIATSTVAPVLSIAWVRNPSVSGESSTTRMMSRRTSAGSSGSGELKQGLQPGHVLLHLEVADQPAQLGDDRGMLGAGAGNLVELRLDAADIADLPEPVQVGQFLHRQRNGTLGLRHGVGVKLPVEAECIADCGEQMIDIDRLGDEGGVVEGMCLHLF